MKHSALQQRKRKSQNEKQEAATCGTQVQQLLQRHAEQCSKLLHCYISITMCAPAPLHYAVLCICCSSAYFVVCAYHRPHTHTHIPYTSVCVCNLVSTQLRVKIFSCQYWWTQHCNFLFYFYFYPFVAALLVLLLLSSTI